MPFLNGVVTYARFAVTGDAPTVIGQSLLDAFAANPARPTPVGVPPGPEAGWTAGRHILDESFEFDRMCFGEWIHAAMRLDVARVPPEVRRAYVAIAESGRASATEDGAQGGLTRAARKEARAEAQQQWEKEIGKGRYRSSKLVPILWNPGKRVLLSPATTDSVIAPLRELFTATFGGRIEHRSSGSHAFDILARRGQTSSFEDAQPDALGQAPSGGGEGRPDVPWANVGLATKDFLGNVFLLWLWWRCETGDGVLDLPDGGSISLALDRTLESECAWGVAGRQSLVGDAPTTWPEAHVAARSGKWPRRVGVLLSDGERDWACALQGDRFIVCGLRLPRSVVPAESEIQADTERIESIEAFDRALQGLYDVFLRERFGTSWTTTRGLISEWMRGRSRRSGGQGDGKEKLRVKTRSKTNEEALATAP